MESVHSDDISENMLTASKIDIPRTCEQSIELTKMEIVDSQPEVHLESTNSQHIIETQYINLHRVPELNKNLNSDSISSELLSHHVVNLGSNQEFSQHVTNAQFYDNADFLTQSFSEEDPRLALVAVQLIQQNRNNNVSSENNLHADIINSKTTLSSVSQLSNEKSVMSSIIPNYVQTVESPTTRNQSNINIHIHNPNHAQVDDQPHVNKGTATSNDQIIKLYQPFIQDTKLHLLPPLKKINQSLSSRNTKYISSDENITDNSMLMNADLNPVKQTTDQIHEPVHIVKLECDVSSDLNVSPNANETAVTDDYDSDCHNDALPSQKSLPHKKRIPSKLKRALTTSTPTRNIHAKCYKCTKCGEQFPTQATFNNHKLQHSNKKNSYSCELCSKICMNQLEFFEHLKSHYEPELSTNENNIASESTQRVAQEQFDQQEEIRIPKIENELSLNNNPDHASYTAESHPVFTCGKCGRVFRRQKAFDCHMSISHPKQEDIEEFSEPEDMMEGIRHVVNMVPAIDEEDKNFEPWQSSKEAENKALQPVVQNGPSTINCTTNVSSSTKSLIQIKDEKDDNEEIPKAVKTRKETSCPHCERTFVHRNSLLYHIRSHTGHRPHQCELCGKSFFAAGALKIHARLHTGDKPYKCEYCGRFFRQWGDLKYHITSLHSNTKMFQCEYCGKDFARKYSLVVHRRIHTGEKNYICEYCTKTFRAASYLQNHRRIHTGEKPHMCEVCGKPFRVRSDMKRHMKTHGDVGVVNVLTDLSNNTPDNNSSDVREISCLVNNQEISIEKQEETNNASLSDQESDQNSKPVISDSVSPLNLNVRPSTTADSLYNYSREDLVDRENSDTLYVWIQTNPDTILTNPDTILPDA